MQNQHYVIRSNVSLLAKKEKKDTYTIEFLFAISRRVVTFQVNTKTFETLKLLDGSHSLYEIAQLVRRDIIEVTSIVEQLLQEQIIEEFSQDHQDTSGIFVRQLNFFAGFGGKSNDKINLQNRIETSSVLILGTGGVGSWATIGLARVGVGTLILIDPDIISSSNISHQACYSTIDIGSKKVQVLSEYCKRINPKIRVKTIDRHVQSVSALLRHINDISLVVNCADEPSVESTNLLVSKACFSKKIPHLLCGGYEGHECTIGQTVIPYQTSCWCCYVEGKIYEKLTRGFQHVPISRVEIEGGTIAPIAAIVGNLYALEALKVLTGYAKPNMYSHKGEFDFGSSILSKVHIPRRRNCSLCGHEKKVS